MRCDSRPRVPRGRGRPAHGIRAARPAVALGGFRPDGARRDWDAIGLTSLPDDLPLDPQATRAAIEHVTELVVLVALMGVGLAMDRPLDPREPRQLATVVRDVAATGGRHASDRRGRPARVGCRPRTSRRSHRTATVDGSLLRGAGRRVALLPRVRRREGTRARAGAVVDGRRHLVASVLVHGVLATPVMSRLDRAHHR